MTNDGLPIHCGGSRGSGNFHAWQGPLVCMDALNWSVYRPCLFPKVTSIDLIKISASRSYDVFDWLGDIAYIGVPRMRERPIADLVDGLKQLDAEVHCFLGMKCPPVQIVSKGGLPGGKACTKASPYEGPFRDDAPSWCWAPFEPEGILRATAPLLLFSLWSLEFILDMSFIHMKDRSSRLLHWVGMGITLLVLGIILHLTDGAAALVFPAFYVMIDILNWKYLFLPLEWIGMNAMLVYVKAAAGIFAGFINGWYYEEPHNTLNNIEIVKTDGIFVSFQLIALLVRHHRRKLPEYDHVVPEE
ncbi:putative F-actin-capping protein subunit alpha-like [Capsicum annuum]|nr:putative F-actin-capping protein subunit alpha-like [Capsicum annuum]KAF3668019.1 putative F-actin-capping protein subunit alpha-like [Capsicum annuum]